MKTPSTWNPLRRPFYLLPFSRLLLPALIFSCILLSPSPIVAQDHPIAITGARVFPVSGPALENATVLIQDGKIAAVGKKVSIPSDAERIDGKGRWVLPGLIDSRTHLGVYEVSLSAVTRDDDEKSDPITPQVRVIDAFYDESENIPVTRQTGVAVALVSPGHENLINGQSAVVDLSGKDLSDVLLKFPAAMHFSLGEPPKARYGKRTKSPTTRMGNASLIRTALVQAQDYRNKWLAFENEKKACQKKSKKAKKGSCPPSPPARDLREESLVQVLDGRMPAIFRAQRVDDILTALRLAEEFDLEITLSHAAEAYKVANLLATRKIPVIVGPISTQPETIETLGAIYENASLLVEAGVKIAIQTDDTNDSRILPWETGLAVTYGLPWEEALKAITLNAAEILGVADRVGSLDKGKDATLIVTTGDPFQPLTQVQHLFIRGEEMPLRSRQEELADKYR